MPSSICKTKNLRTMCLGVFLVAVFIMPTCIPAQSAASRPDDISIDLVRENEFVVKMMDVFDTSGKKLKGLVELDSFRNKEKAFVFKTAGGKLQKVSAKKISKIVISRLRQGVLTGKPSSLRVNAWNGKTRNFELNAAELRINGGTLFLSQKEFLKRFDESDKLRASGDEWSEKLHNFWQRKQKESPKVFSTHFAFKNGRGFMSRKMAAAYCRTCLKVEVLKLSIDSKKETISIRCQDVFYDKYNE